MKLSVFNNLTNFGIDDPRMTTIAGVVLRYLDRLPVVGDQVTVEGVLLEVLAMEDLRIERIRASRGVALQQTVPEETESTTVEGRED